VNSTGPALLKAGVLHKMRLVFTNEAYTLTEPNLQSNAVLNLTGSRRFYPVTLIIVPPAFGPFNGSILSIKIGPFLFI
jgi:hypothetical protein